MSGEALGDLIETLGSIDHDEIDWPNIARATYLICQQFRYTYPAPVTELRQRLMLTPPDWHEDQRLVTHKLRVSASNVDVERSSDTFGNVILDISVEGVADEILFTTWAVVERAAPANGVAAPDPVPPDFRLAEPSRLVGPDDALRAAAAELVAGGAQGLELAEQINAAVHRRFAYAGGATNVHTTAAEAWSGGVGVCQDYAHCMIALCRLVELPTRYISGHLLGEGGTHAWVEVLVPHRSEPDALEAVAFDPTNDRRATLRYVTVAVGRDYADVAPISGTYIGPASHELQTHKRAAVTQVEYLRPRRRARRHSPTF